MRSLSSARTLALALPFALVALASGRVEAQSSTPPGRPSGAVVGGVVHDSIGHAPVTDAIVQLVAADPSVQFGQSTRSDSTGRFVFRDVPNGRYNIGFLHPLLDSLGLEPSVHEIYVDNGRAVRADLAIPSAARVRAAVCGRSAMVDQGGVVLGFVRRATDRSATAGAKVTAQWLEVTFGNKEISRRTPRATAMTAESGWYAICNVPRDGTMLLLAERGRDSTDVIEVMVPSDGLLRRELYLGAARVTASRDSAAADGATADTTTNTNGNVSTGSPMRSRRVLTGDGRLNGSVLTAVNKTPLAGAQVRIVDGPVAVANARGEWSLANAPTGSRMLEIRAVGYYPARRAVEVFPAGATASGTTMSVRVELATLKSVLDTVRTTANRNADRFKSGFFDRARTGQGRYLTAEDIARRPVLYTSELFRTIAGVRVETDGTGPSTIFVRGAGSEEFCPAPIFLNGAEMHGLDVTQLDAFIKPKEILGIEVYSGRMVPPRFQSSLLGCGAIVIWSK